MKHTTIEQLTILELAEYVQHIGRLVNDAIDLVHAGLITPDQLGALTVGQVEALLANVKKAVAESTRAG